ncbi:MAG TPA: SDR family NAD(P)-dependent oxidoreductase [Spirochaetia bacterium]|nr:SDR family NAD(P)-dependent oxidoreductase [Spirochaetia bacterium]
MVVVTGAAGHLGAALVRELIADGEKVRAFVLPGEDISGLLGLPLEIVRGNILQRESIVPAVRGAEVVYHLAGIVSIMPGRDELMRRVNVEGSANVARAAREAGVPKMVYVSSIHALQRPASGIPIDERVPFDPHNAAGEYDQTKAEASLAVLAEADKGLDAVIVCPTGIIGPFDFRGLSPMTRQIRAWTRPGRHLMINGHFDFVDARDVGRGMILAARRGGRGSVYILSGERVSVPALYALVRKCAGGKGAGVLVPFAAARLIARLATLHSLLWGTKVQFTRYALETLESNSDISCGKSRQELGYEPRPMLQTIRDTVLWLRDNPQPAPQQVAAFERARGRGPGAKVPGRTQVAVVTGASSGIGAVTARKLAARGYKVFLVARRADRLGELAARIGGEGGRAEVVAADLAAPAGVRRVYDRVVEAGEGIDVLVNSAGFGWYGYASDMPAETAWDMIRVNNAALAELILLFLPMMRGTGRGHVINISSIVGSFPSPWAAVYSATKSFVDTLTTALHRELRNSGVHVSAVRPGPVLTEFYQTVSKRSSGRSIPVGRFLVPADVVADAVIRLIARPRRAIYVPDAYRVIPWAELAFGWLFDRVAWLLMKRQPNVG